ncbi:hypothetical protein V493_08493 [Pseudogymnoascus sp. VKM F-4281 (FW-2241)]|nr:hypothetical protein V493_08493 [Pseudogymnoascus sp. VKM F-4281 (FW-2241)]
MPASANGIPGDIVRIGPNELHFASPAAYHDIYNSSARWDKERMLYEGFGEDHSSFGMLTYAESRPRKEVLLPLFSRRAILTMQDLVREKVNHFASILERNNACGNSSDLLLGFRCFTIDTITAFCFAQSVEAINETEFAAPIVEAMDNTLLAFHAFKYFPLLRKSILGIPPWLSLKISPQLAGLSRLQMLLGKQVREVIANPDSLKDAPHPIIYSRLLDPDAQKGNPIPDATSLYEEAQSLVFAGGVTVADTLMTGHFHILSQRPLYEQLQAEVLEAWPNIDNPPKLEVLETLPLLTATIKESLRHSPGASSSLLRIVPASGATISGCAIPGGTIVGMSSAIVHKAASIFADPEAFIPARWLGKEVAGLDRWDNPEGFGVEGLLYAILSWETPKGLVSAKGDVRRQFPVHSDELRGRLSLKLGNIGIFMKGVLMVRRGPTGMFVMILFWIREFI